MRNDRKSVTINSYAELDSVAIDVEHIFMNIGTQSSNLLPHCTMASFPKLKSLHLKYTSGKDILTHKQITVLERVFKDVKESSNPIRNGTLVKYGANLGIYDLTVEVVSAKENDHEISTIRELTSSLFNTDTLGQEPIAARSNACCNIVKLTLKGFGHEDVKKILGENAHSILVDVEIDEQTTSDKTSKFKNEFKSIQSKSHGKDVDSVKWLIEKYKSDNRWETINISSLVKIVRRCMVKDQYLREKGEQPMSFEDERKKLWSGAARRISGSKLPSFIPDDLNLGTVLGCAVAVLCLAYVVYNKGEPIHAILKSTNIRLPDIGLSLL